LAGDCDAPRDLHCAILSDHSGAEEGLLDAIWAISLILVGA
jgi:hypothetical protein